MIDGADLISLETATRALINEDTAGLWTSDKVRSAINAEMSRLARKVIDLDAGYFETSQTFTPAATITLPVNCYVVRNVEGLVDSVWYPVRWIAAHNREQYQDLGVSYIPQSLAVRFTEESLVFEGSTTGVSSVRVQYARVPAPMQSLTVSSLSATTAVFDSSTSYYDDVYNGDRIVITSGTGIGQTRTITDYAASTRTITVATWGTNPDTTSVVTWALPDPLYKWPDVVALGAAIRLVGRRRDAETHTVLMSQYTNDLGEMMESLARRQTDQPRHVNHTPDWGE